MSLLARNFMKHAPIVENYLQQIITIKISPTST